MQNGQIARTVQGHFDFFKLENRRKLKTVVIGVLGLAVLGLAFRHNQKTQIKQCSGSWLSQSPCPVNKTATKLIWKQQVRDFSVPESYQS